jgi:hypothetical protein
MVKIHEENVSMLIGPGINQLERRITNALCGGNLRLRESDFLQGISRRIGFYRERAHLSDRQAGWLYTILARSEKGTTDRPSSTRTPVGSTGGSIPHSSPKSASESPELMRALAGLANVSWPEEDTTAAIDFSKALESDSGI